jgi:eukaryotic-like serine/threonine-protein kinase
MWQGAGRLVADRYAIEAVLNGGGLGVVWRARDLASDRPVALKQLRRPDWLPAAELPSLAARVRHEVAAAATVRHPALAAVYELVDDGGRPVVVMELVDGVTLHELVRRHGPLPPRRGAQLAVEVLGGLAALHQAGVLHGAVSPGSVLVTPAGAAKLVGAGTGFLRLHPRALAASAGSARSRVLAPELAAGDAAGPAVDVWASGATLQYAAVGRPPAGDAGPAPELAGWLGSVLGRMLAASPAARPQAGEAARLLVGAAPAGAPLHLPGTPPGDGRPVEQPALVPARAPVAAAAPVIPSPAVPPLPAEGAADATTRLRAASPGAAAMAPLPLDQPPWPAQGDLQTSDAAVPGPDHPPWDRNGLDAAPTLAGPLPWAGETDAGGLSADPGKDGGAPAGRRDLSEPPRDRGGAGVPDEGAGWTADGGDRPRDALAVGLIAVFLAVLAVLAMVVGIRMLARLAGADQPANRPRLAAPPTSPPPSRAAPSSTAPVAVTTTSTSTTIGARLRFDREAESAGLAGGARPAGCDRCSGNAKVGFVGNGGTLTFSGVQAPSLGSYQLSIWYASGERRDALLSIDGGQGLPLSFEGSGGFDRVRRLNVKITLRAGDNTLTFFNPNGFAPDFDRIRIRAA